MPTHEKATVTATNVRRLEVLRKCVSLIFDGKIADARKVGSSADIVGCLYMYMQWYI